MSERTEPMQEIPSWARSDLLRLIAQSSTEYLYILDSSRSMVYASPPVEKLLGYTPEEYLIHFRDIPDWNSPRSRDALKHWEAYGDHPAGQPIPSYLIDLRHRDGSLRTHEVFERWDLSPNCERFLVALAVDVTQKAIIESKFEHLQGLAEVTNYFADFTPEGVKAVYLGPTFERVFGVPREEVMRDATAFMRHLHPEDAEEISREVGLTFAGRGPDRWRLRYRVNHPDGRTVWVSDRGVVERGVDGNPRRLIGLAEDITEVVLAEQEQQGRDAMQVQAQKLEIVGHLAAGVAHNFSNLLLAIQGYIGLAQRTLEPNHPAIEALSKIEETSEQARGLTRSLLTLSHRQPAHRSPMDLSSSLEGAIRLLRRTLPTSVVVVPGIEPGVWVLGDASQIDQVVLNTSLNARDAMPDGGELSINLSSGDGHAVLIIEDTGHGMDGPTQAQAFEPFFTTKAPDDGTGLGLSISRGIIVDHSGTIELHSVPGEGTRLEITLPVLAAGVMAPDPEAGPVSAGETVLMLHPPGLVHRVVKTMLEELGYRVVICESLSDASEQLSRGEASGMLIDPATACLAEQGTPEEGLQQLLDSTGSTSVAVVTDEPGRWQGLRLGSGGVLLPRPFMRVDLAVALTQETPT
ncbi:MAG: PAS domain S-box-containing protein [Phycisphaerales bacterium]|jgi:PAS domain S-box-containing protein